jgi:flagellin-like hook-associated protein FlgL
VQEVLDRINAAAVAAGIDPDDFTATLAATGNGITLTDNTTGAAGAVTTLEALNGSFAAEDLGLLPSTPSQPGAPPQIHSWTGASFTGEDRATIAVNGVFANLMALRDALLSNDERGIEFATQRLEADLSRLTAARSDVGIRSRIVRDALGREEDLKIQDTALKSQLQDLDYADAATRFTALQQQLQAAMLTAARTQSMSLLDFLR